MTLSMTRVSVKTCLRQSKTAPVHSSDLYSFSSRSFSTRSSWSFLSARIKTCGRQVKLICLKASTSTRLNSRIWCSTWWHSTTKTDLHQSRFESTPGWNWVKTRQVPMLSAGWAKNSWKKMSSATCPNSKGLAWFSKSEKRVTRTMSSKYKSNLSTSRLQLSPTSCASNITRATATQTLSVSKVSSIFKSARLTNLSFNFVSQRSCF